MTQSTDRQCEWSRSQESPIPLGETVLPPCPVCLASAPRPLCTLEGRDYWRCRRCAVRFLDPAHHPSPDSEFDHYRLHENDPDDSGYRRFLAKLAAPLLERLPPACRGLDYGCGPGPALARMLEDAGHTVALYDPFFFPDTTALQRRYDFVACTETAEHFHRPADDFERMMTVVRPGGRLAIMTCFQTDDSQFADWHYRRDPTHVVFYRAETFHWLAAARGWSCEIPVKDVALLGRPPETGDAA